MHPDGPLIVRCPVCVTPDPDCALCPDGGGVAPAAPTATLVERRVVLSEAYFCPLGSP